MRVGDWQNRWDGSGNRSTSCAAGTDVMITARKRPETLEAEDMFVEADGQFDL
jgi:hypothetical protein